MILVDTSVWVEHVRRGNQLLADLLEQNRVLSHPFVVGEIALAGFRPEVIASLRKLPRAVVASDDEVLGLIERNCFAGRGVGYVDAHLLASARLTDEATVWTVDKKLRTLVEDLGLSATVSH